MAGDDSQLLLSACVLLILALPLSPSSPPEEDMGALGSLPEDREQPATSPETTPWWVMVVAESLVALPVELLMTAIVHSLGRRLCSCWGEEKRQSPSVSAGRCCCQGHGCSKELLQLQRQNRALMRLCLRLSSLQRPRQKTAAKWGLWKRTRLHFSPQL